MHWLGRGALINPHFPNNSKRTGQEAILCVFKMCWWGGYSKIPNLLGRGYVKLKIYMAGRSKTTSSPPPPYLFSCNSPYLNYWQISHNVWWNWGFDYIWLNIFQSTTVQFCGSKLACIWLTGILDVLRYSSSASSEPSVEACTNTPLSCTLMDPSTSSRAACASSCK